MDNESDTIILEEINKSSSQSLKKKLLFVKKLTKERDEVEKEYRKELVQLQYSYEEKYKKIYEEANKIIHGEVTELAHLVTQADMEKFKVNSQQTTPLEKGIPSFWNIALQKSKYFYLNKKDEEIMKFFNDICMNFREDKVSFSVTFKFAPNEYFNNAEITKTYFLNEYQEVERVESTLINWTSDEKNPMKEMKKKQKKKGKEVKTTNTWEEVESFFKIFRNLSAKDAEDDYEISLEERETEFWKEDFFPNALGYYLDIIPLEGEDDFEDEEDEDDDDGDNKKKDKKGGSSGKDESKEKCKNQ